LVILEGEASGTAYCADYINDAGALHCHPVARMQFNVQTRVSGLQEAF
jgi:hypothetical protein